MGRKRHGRGLVHHCAQSKWDNSNTGAGANAKSRSRLDMLTYMGSGPLAELVWSPLHGLSIKCAGCTSGFSDTKPLFLWDVGTSKSRSITTQGSKDEERVNEGHSVVSRSTFRVDGTEENVDEMNCAEKVSVVEHVEETDDHDRNKGKENECLSSSKSIIPLERSVPDSPSSVGTRIDKGKAKMEEDSSSSNPLRIAEDAILERVQNNDFIPHEASSTHSRICVSRKRPENGEKSMYRRENDEKHEADSDGSMETGNSANVMPKRKRKWRFDHQLILGSKRIKKQTQECLISKPVVKQDSSFMNWISNMVKGLNRPNQEEVHSLALTVGHPIVDYEDYDQKMSVCDKARSLEGGKLGFETVFQSLFSPDAKAHKTLTQIEKKPVGGSKQIVVADKTHAAENSKQIAIGHEENTSIHGTTLFDSVKTSKTINDDLGNLWITRLYPKTRSTPLTINHSDNKSLKAKDSSTDNTSASDGLRNVYNEDKCQKPVGVTSLGTLKRGFWLEKCRTETEFNFEPKENGKRVLNYESFVKQQSASSSGKDKKLYDEKITLWSQFVSKQIEGAPKGMFDIVRRLRLSRTHILKWTNSQFSAANLDGFFLRLRLAKWEEELGGAGYYVAYITGSQGDKTLKGSKKPILVNVGGVECLVETRYVSNCDFLDGELVEWWEKTSRNGWIPRVENLKSKLEERKKLGL